MDKNNISSCSMFLCERMLVESDNVLSAIRMIDVYYVGPQVVIPQNKEISEEVRRAIDDMAPVANLNCVFHIKTHSPDTAEHTFELRILRVNGTEGALLPVRTISLAPNEEGTPGGLSIGVSFHLGVKNFGTAYILAFIDGQEIARTPVTIKPLPPTAPTSD